MKVVMKQLMNTANSLAVRIRKNMIMHWTKIR